MGNGLIRELLGIGGEARRQEAEMRQLEMQIKQAQLQRLMTPEPTAMPDPYKQLQAEKLQRDMYEQDRRNAALMELAAQQESPGRTNPTGLSPSQMQALAVVDPKAYAEKTAEQGQKARAGEQMFSSLEALRAAYDELQNSGGAVTSQPDGLGGALKNFGNLTVASDNPVSSFISKLVTPSDNEQRFKIRAMAGGMLPLMMAAQGGSSKMFDTAAERQGFLAQLGDPSQPVEANLALLDKLQKDLVETSGFQPPQEQAPMPRRSITPEEARQELRRRQQARERR